MAQNLDFGMKCIKYMLFVSNFMFVMVGVLLISFGSAIKSLYTEFELFMEDHYFSPAQLTIAIGFIILLISFFGCVAAIKESACLVNMYAVLLTLVLILEIAAAISAYAMRSSIEHYLEKSMKDAMKEYSENNETKYAVDKLQDNLQCCGIWKEGDWMEFTNETMLPNSCCGSHKSPGDGCNPDDGCLPRLSFIMDQSAVMLGTSSLCIVIVQILGIAFAVMLSKAIRRLKTAIAMQRWQDRTELYLQLARGHDKNPPTPVPVTYTVGNTPDSSVA